MKKFLVVLAILFIGILLVGCTSKPAASVATPAPTKVPTAVVTAPPTPVPTKEVVVAVVTTTAIPTPTPTPKPQPTVTITFGQAMTITPSTTVSIPAGGKVIWMNMDALKPHGIQSASFTTQASAASIPYGKTLEITFDKVGTFDYTTTFQPQKLGKIIVTAK